MTCALAIFMISSIRMLSETPTAKTIKVCSPRVGITRS